MREQVYIDLDPDLVDVPDETWQGIGPVRLLVDYMLSRVPADKRDQIATQGLRKIAAAMQYPTLSPQAREMITPGLAEKLDHAQVLQAFEG